MDKIEMKKTPETAVKETRAFSFEMRAARDDAHGDSVYGTPVVFNSATNMGSYDEVIDSTALDNADLTDVRFLVNHDTSMIPLARSRNNNENSTMQLIKNEGGLDIRVSLDTENNTEARNLYSAISRGDVSGMSFMFTVNDALWENLDSDHPVRHIRSIGRIFEVSAVTFPAYEATSIQARSDSEKALESALAALESARTEERKKELRKHILKERLS